MSETDTETEAFRTLLAMFWRWRGIKISRPRHIYYVRTRACACCPAMRVDIIGHFKPCMTDIYLHIDARMADYIRTHP